MYETKRAQRILIFEHLIPINFGHRTSNDGIIWKKQAQMEESVCSFVVVAADYFRTLSEGRLHSVEW
jgi:hypothetical protein